MNQKHEMLMTSHAKMEAAIADGENGMRDSEGIELPDCSKLIPFTGYYPLDVSQDGFLSIDTTEYRSISSILPLNYSTIEISISLDGILSEIFPFSFETEFDGKTLIIPNVLTLEFTRDYNDGLLTSLSGKIGTTKVTGSTRFNPVPLSSFVGEYFQIDPPLSAIKNALTINSETEILFDFGTDTLSHVKSYSYNPAMYVIAFTDDNGEGFVLMLGTAGSMGLAASIQTMSMVRLAVSAVPVDSDN